MELDLKNIQEIVTVKNTLNILTNSRKDGKIEF